MTDILIVNRSTGEPFRFQYLDLNANIEWGSGTARYEPAQMPQVAVHQAFFLGTSGRSRNISGIIFGADARNQMGAIERMKQVNAETRTPPPCWLVVGALTPVSMVIVDLRFGMDVKQFKNNLPYRVAISVDYFEVGETAIA